MIQPNTSAQRAQDPGCHHSKEAFDCLFACVARRRDISPTAKLVHATLVSQHRLSKSWTQTEIGERLGLSRHQVWRAIDELVAAGAVQVIRYGLGRPNGYILLGIAQEDLDGKAPRKGSRPAGHQYAGQFYSKRRPPIRKEELRKIPGTPDAPKDCRFPQYHHEPAFQCCSQKRASAAPD